MWLIWFTCFGLVCLFGCLFVWITLLTPLRLRLCTPPLVFPIPPSIRHTHRLCLAPEPIPLSCSSTPPLPKFECFISTVSAIVYTTCMVA
ncbi:hypothetical protein LXA43DRAFT_62443 [Ganoderma leucocontextum]|nr:hypothetical protein LXA43DRAFT_62443 [Ganoderma leucocontextum]